MFNCLELITPRIISPAFFDELMDRATSRMIRGVWAILGEFKGEDRFSGKRRVNNLKCFTTTIIE